MRILVDLDGTIADWGKRYDAGLDARLGTFGIPRTSRQQSFDLFAGRTKNEQAIIREVMDEPGFYAELEPIPGAVDALAELVAAGHEVFICTSPWPTNPTCAQDKLDWIARHLGVLWLKRTIITHHKADVHADILIDDRPDIPNRERASWVQILFDQPYNRDEDSMTRPRIIEWASWREVVDPVLGVVEVLHEANAEGEVRAVSATGGEKGVKPQRYDLLPVHPLNLLAELYGRGAEKYAAHNWRRGYPWSSSYAAAMRHMTRFWAGEDIDPEMGLPHVTCAAFHLFALAQFMSDFPEYDDRFGAQLAIADAEGEDG